MYLERLLDVIQFSPVLRAGPAQIRLTASFSWLLRSHLQGRIFHNPFRYLLQYLNTLLVEEKKVSGSLIGISHHSSCQNMRHRIASFTSPFAQAVSGEVHATLLSGAGIKCTSCITEELHKPQAPEQSSCRVLRPTRTIAKLLFQNGTGLFCHQ